MHDLCKEVRTNFYHLPGRKNFSDVPRLHMRRPPPKTGSWAGPPASISTGDAWNVYPHHVHMSKRCGLPWEKHGHLSDSELLSVRWVCDIHVLSLTTCTSLTINSSTHVYLVLSVGQLRLTKNGHARVYTPMYKLSLVCMAHITEKTGLKDVTSKLDWAGW